MGAADTLEQSLADTLDYWRGSNMRKQPDRMSNDECPMTKECQINEGQ